MLEIDYKRCISCGGCVGVCPVLALNLKEGRTLFVDNKICINCRICEKFCPAGALSVKK